MPVDLILFVWVLLKLQHGESYRRQKYVSEQSRDNANVCIPWHFSKEHFMGITGYTGNQAVPLNFLKKYRSHGGEYGAFGCLLLFRINACSGLQPGSKLIA